MLFQVSRRKLVPINVILTGKQALLAKVAINITPVTSAGAI